jgi:hypothetical protein
MSAEDDAKAKQTVLTVLRHKSLAMVDFTINKRRISPEVYQKVAEAIEGDRITVMVAPNLLKDGEGGRYIQALTLPDKSELYDLLVLRFTAIEGNISQQMMAAQVIVHECTHAAFDLLKTKGMNHLEHEAAAYIAGARFVVEAMMEKGGKPEKVTFIQAIETAAWNIALKQAEGVDVPRNLYNALDVAILKSPTYAADAKKAVVNDGVGKTWKPAPGAPRPVR